MIRAFIAYNSTIIHGSYYILCFDTVMLFVFIASLLICLFCPGSPHTHKGSQHALSLSPTDLKVLLTLTSPPHWVMSVSCYYFSPSHPQALFRKACWCTQQVKWFGRVGELPCAHRPTVVVKFEWECRPNSSWSELAPANEIETELTLEITLVSESVAK